MDEVKKQELKWEFLISGFDRKRRKLYKAVVWIVALYGVETWTLLSGDITKLEAFEMWL